MQGWYTIKLLNSLLAHWKVSVPRQKPFFSLASVCSVSFTSMCVCCVFVLSLFLKKMAFDFCHRFFHPRHNGQWTPTLKDFLSQILSITFFSYLNSWERASISLLMLSVKQGNYWYHFLLSLWYDAVLVGGLNPEPPALEASTLPLAYRRGGDFCTIMNTVQYGLGVLLWVVPLTDTLLYMYF